MIKRKICGFFFFLSATYIIEVEPECVFCVFPLNLHIVPMNDRVPSDFFSSFFLENERKNGRTYEWLTEEIFPIISLLLLSLFFCTRHELIFCYEHMLLLIESLTTTRLGFLALYPLLARDMHARTNAFFP